MAVSGFSAAHFPPTFPGQTPPFDPAQSNLPSWLRQVTNPGSSFMRGVGNLVSGGNPAFNFGLSLLSVSRPRPVGTSSLMGDLGAAVQFADQRQQAAMQSQIVQQQLMELQRRRQQQSAMNALIAEMSGPSSPGFDPRQQQLMQLMAQTNPQAAMQILAQRGGLLSEEPTGLQAKLSTVERALGRPLSQEEILGLAGGGSAVTVNLGESQANEPIPVTQLDTIRMPDGSTPPIGTTFGQAQAAGARVFTADELKRQAQVESALDVFTEIKGLAVGPEGVFNNVPTNVLGRWARGISNALGDAVGTEAGVRRSLYRDLSAGVVGPLVRTLGESGALAEGDVQRALALLPNNEGLLPESGELAEAKLGELEAIFRKAEQRLSAGSGTTNSGAVDIGGGVTVEFLD